MTSGQNQLARCLRGTRVRSLESKRSTGRKQCPDDTAGRLEVRGKNRKEPCRDLNRSRDERTTFFTTGQRKDGGYKVMVASAAHGSAASH